MLLAQILSKDRLKQSTHESTMLSVFTSHVTRTRTLGNQCLSMFSFSIYLHHYHECHANTLELPNNNGLKQSSYISAISSSAQLNIPYCKNKKCMKAKINFF